MSVTSTAILWKTLKVGDYVEFQTIKLIAIAVRALK